MRAKLPDLAVYPVSDPSARIGVEAACVAAARGGARLVQLRDKTASDEELAALARRLVALLDQRREEVVHLFQHALDVLRLQVGAHL